MEKATKMLRERAEAMLRASPSELAGMTTEDVQALVHELQVHQVELEIQNEELRQAQVELSESRDRYSDLYEFAPVGYVTLDNTGKILEANLTATRLLGRERQELVRCRLSDFVARDGQDDWYLHRQAVVSNESQQTCELEMHKADGTALVVRLESIGFGDPPHRRCRTALIDNTAWNRAEEELRRLNATLESRVAEQTREVHFMAEAVAHLAEGVVITDDELNWPGPRIRFVNDAMCRITGYAADELIGKTPRILQGQQSDRATLDRLKRELSDGRSFLGELVNYRKDGTPYDAELFITSIFDAARRRTSFVSIHRDITERKRTEHALRESEERMRAILDAADDAIITIDQRGRITSINRATEKMFGYAAGELLGQNIGKLMPPPYCDDYDAYIARYLETRRPRIIGGGREVSGLRKDGSTFPVDLMVSEIEQVGFTGIIRDISERKALQQEVLAASMDEQRRIGHELHDGTQQELTGLTLLAGSLLDLLNVALEERAADQSVSLLDSPGYKRFADSVKKLCQRLSEANRHVQQLAHGVIPVQVDAEGLRSALEELAVSTNGLNEITCRFKSQRPVKVMNNTTATHLYRIAQEAVNNALRHGQADEIQISFEQQDGQLLLEVRDNGVGIETTATNSVGPGNKNNSMGLRIMEYRAGIIGGSLHIERGETEGTIVRCVVLAEREPGKRNIE